MEINFFSDIKANYFKHLYNKKDKVKKIFYSTIGFFAGFLNGLLGAGGGMLIVPALSKLGVERKKAHATSICVILPICILSSVMYISSGKVSIFEAVPYIGWGIVGAVVGAMFLSKINQKFLKKIFGIFMIWAAFQLLFR
ncbi:MAG: hypothetical protein RUMPE_00257 [Eubacteriales bacterium SKADARSKE-1]|nr:hypothetical protein [Eubacteriales bacterium SKADARSKE-1]